MLDGYIVLLIKSIIFVSYLYKTKSRARIEKYLDAYKSIKYKTMEIIGLN